MTKVNTILLPIYSAIFAGITGYIVNYAGVEQIFLTWQATGWGYYIAILEAGLHYENLYIFIGIWTIVGLGAAFKTSNYIKGALAPILGFLGAFILWNIITSFALGVLVTDRFIATMPMLQGLLIPGIMGIGAGTLAGFGLGYFRWYRATQRIVKIADPVIEFIPKCPNCGTKNHSNAVFCSICGTEIFKGMGEGALISEEQQTVTGLV